MSVSSLGAAAVLPGGSSRSDSVSEGGSADSLFIRDIHDRRERKRLELEKELTDSDEDSGGFFHDLLRQFRHCCAGRKKSRLAYGEGAYSGVATAAADGFAAAVAKGPPRARTYSGSVTGSHSGSSSSTATRSDLADKYIGDKAYMAIRIVGMYVRRHGELTEYAAFNVTPNEKELFPPSFLGFKTLEDMQEYVLELFKRDFRVKRASGVSALLFKSRTLHTAAPERADYTAERESRADVLAKLQDLREKDPKYDAKMLYTNMFKATADEENPDEVFAL
ncbi:uncharacterized protein LOC34622955 [Cyclospora cayetanensis]|uniref:Uncharacterized protein LOC34622955 n=1 Tax=Cyclospora cayetanensis TaxID=88456 RepID=A0A6P6RZX5_9EIME|nr:uncharacterized protein LOC34622955 [Cyclospora cayetanensis]